MKRILLSVVAICAATTINAQITNGDLENWTSGEPDGWLYDFGAGMSPGTNNWVATLGEGDPTTCDEITGAAAAGGTGSSAFLETKDAVGATLLANSITQIEGMLIGEWSYTGMPATFSFDYDVQPMTGDTAIVQLSFYNASGTDIGVAGGFFTDADATTGWTNASVPVYFYGAGPVVSVEVWAQSSYSADGTPITGSTLAVDNFAVSGVNGVEELAFSVNAYPNPAINVLNIDMSANVTSASIIGLNGVVISTQTVNSNTTSIDVSSLTPGVYFYEVVSEGAEVVRQAFVKK